MISLHFCNLYTWEKQISIGRGQKSKYLKNVGGWVHPNTCLGDDTSRWQKYMHLIMHCTSINTCEKFVHHDETHDVMITDGRKHDKVEMYC